MLKRVLVIEDDEAIVRLLQVVLSEGGYKVAVAASAERAFGEVLIRDPDVILLDLYLRGAMNGADFLDGYRTSGGRAKVIAVSAATPSDPMARRLRVDEFIGKPFDIDQLMRSVARFAHA